MTWIFFWAITLCTCQRPLPLPVSSVKERNRSKGLFSRWSPSVTSFPSSQSSLGAERTFTVPFPKPGETWTLGGSQASVQVTLRSTPPSRQCRLGLQPLPLGYRPSCLGGSLSFKLVQKVAASSQRPLLSSSLVTVISTPRQTS